MARNEEKHYGRLNRLYLEKEKEEYEKANPKRPKLDMLYTPDEIQKWLPSIKKDIDFYLKKSQVTCYSDAHVEDCKTEVVKLEKEFKAFIRKMKQLSPLPLEAIPWTSRPYKRKKSYDSEESSSKEFKRIATPIIDEEVKSDSKTSHFLNVNWSEMDQPLNFSSVSTNCKKTEKEEKISSNLNISSLCAANSDVNNFDQYACLKTMAHKEYLDHTIDRQKTENDTQPRNTIVNYDSSDSECS